MSAIYENAEQLELSAHILTKLTNAIPSVQIDMQHWQHLNGLTLADPHFLQPLSVDMIIGADVYHQIIREGLKKGPIDSPIAQLTAFGWIISGPISAKRTSVLVKSYHVSMDQQLYDVLRKFWELEEVSINKSSSLSPEEQDCEKHFQDTYSRDPQGRYVVCLPFKKPVKELGDSRHKASRMLTSLWNKFKSDIIYAQAYSKFMTEYKDLHHMRLIDHTQPEPQPNFYLPHHGVWKESSTTTKLRVVFNGSSRTTSRISLNDILHTGPKLQLELLDISKRCIARSMSIRRTGNTSEYYGQRWKIISIHTN
ncbi:Gag-pol polyprotein [Camponotus japonicus]